ncbi:DUF3954 domain-containing protein [Jeotgalibacillus soli]|uniref:DUF3954 domain-containing protein n=1 Tax=Jeotgalibacillus soli TaxID=889306 RepID=A0A0C2V9V5_9BACL|nr:DUF3954 domain-containing protein [Jeotgalibacillus soli]KIL45742.1 hypothetical protein KP78_20910 [Jeotgalibacillus soli]
MEKKISLMENAVYVVKDGQLTKVTVPSGGFGTDEVVWQNGTVIDVIRSQRQRISGQSEI